MKLGKIGSNNESKMGDVCLGSFPEKVLPKKYLFDLGVTEELPPVTSSEI